MAPHCAASAQRREDGQLRDGRHHDQGRPVGRLQRLPHGQHRRERRPASGRSPARSRTSSRSPRRTRPRPRRRPASSRTRSSPVTIKTPQGRHRGRHRRISQARHHARRRSPSCARPSPRTAPSPPRNASGINDGAAAVVLMTRERGAKARQDAARAHRLLGACRRRSGDHGHRADPGLARGAQEGRLERSAIST